MPSPQDAAQREAKGRWLENVWQPMLQQRQVEVRASRHRVGPGSSRGRKFELWEYVCNIVFNDLMTYDIIVSYIYICILYIYILFIYTIYNYIYVNLGGEMKGVISRV